MIVSGVVCAARPFCRQYFFYRLLSIKYVNGKYSLPFWNSVCHPAVDSLAKNMISRKDTFYLSKYLNCVFVVNKINLIPNIIRCQNVREVSFLLDLIQYAIWKISKSKSERTHNNYTWLCNKTSIVNFFLYSFRISSAVDDIVMYQKTIRCMMLKINCVLVSITEKPSELEYR